MSAPFRRFGEPCRRQTGEKGNRFFAAGVGKAGEATTRMHGSDFPRACGVGASVPISRASGRNAGKEWCAPGVAFASRRMPTSPYSRHKLRRAAARADDERAAACPVRRLEAMPWPDFSHVFQGGRNDQADVSGMSRMNGISGIIRAVPRAGGAFVSRRMPTSPYSRHRLRRAAARADDERAASCPVRRLAAKAVA